MSSTPPGPPAGPDDFGQGASGQGPSGQDPSDQGHDAQWPSTPGSPQPPAVGGQPPQPGAAPDGGQPYASPSQGYPQPGTPAAPYYAASPAADPNRPGSKAWVEQRYGKVTDFGDRIVPYIIDMALMYVVLVITLCIGGILVGAGSPDTTPCYYGSYTDCSVPGTGNAGVVALGITIMFLGSLAALLFIFWNRVWRVSKTGQSLGRKVTGLHVINAETGQHPGLGEAFVRELVASFAGIISAIWIFIDDDSRTLGDIVGKTAVIKDAKN